MKFSSCTYLLIVFIPIAFLVQRIESKQLTSSTLAQIEEWNQLRREEMNNQLDQQEIEESIVLDTSPVDEKAEASRQRPAFVRRCVQTMRRAFSTFVRRYLVAPILRAIFGEDGRSSPLVASKPEVIVRPRN